jgi:ABC-type uncharacterized transport system substrate-binding protein
MKRREFITLLGGAAVGWPLAARAQQPRRMRRIGVVTALRDDDPSMKRQLAEFRRALETLGWADGKDVEFVYFYAAGSPERAREFAKDVIRIHPDVIVAHTTPATAALHQATRTVPIVFVSISDPVAGGFVTNLAHPGGNLTGFTNYEFSMGAKWLEILMEIAPATARVALMLNPDMATYYAEYLRPIETVALSKSVQATLAPVRSSDEIESIITALAREAGGGLIVLPSAPITANIQAIIDLTSRYRLPAVYPFGSYARQGGLVAYGTSLDDLFRRSASYVDRILRGEKPAELPVQAPTKFELVLNLKTAKALGLDVPPTLLARADEVIE